jgi:hypothetical protein
MNMHYALKSHSSKNYHISGLRSHSLRPMIYFKLCNRRVEQTQSLHNPSNIALPKIRQRIRSRTIRTYFHKAYLFIWDSSTFWTRLSQFNGP